MGCRQRRPQEQLVRIALVNGVLRLSRTAPGRGAWLCPTETCLQAATARRGFDRALRTTITPVQLEGLSDQVLLGR